MINCFNASWLSFIAVVASSSALAAGALVSLEDHSLPKARVHTYYGTCSSKRFVVIHADPAASQICGSSQDANSKQVCMPRPDGDAAEAVRSLASQLCL